MAQRVLPPRTGNKPRLVLIDGNNQVHRHYHGMPEMKRKDGTPVNALLGFVQQVLALHEELHKGDSIGVAFDTAANAPTSKTTFRHKLYKGYKANRGDSKPELHKQMAMAMEAMDVFRVKRLIAGGYEADDMVATYATLGAKAGYDVIIITSDKDAMQLVTPDIRVYDPLKKKTFDEAAVCERYGIRRPKQMIDFQSLVGDKGDCVPGVSGFSPNRTVELLRKFGSVKKALLKLGKVKKVCGTAVYNALKNGKAQAKLCRKLVKLKTDLPVRYKIQDLKVALPIDYNSLRKLCVENQFQRMLDKLPMDRRGQKGLFD